MSEQIKKQTFLLDGDAVEVEYSGANVGSLINSDFDVSIHSIDNKPFKECSIDELRDIAEQIFMHEYKCMIENRDSGCPHDNIFQEG